MLTNAIEQTNYKQKHTFISLYKRIDSDCPEKEILQATNTEMTGQKSFNASNYSIMIKGETMCTQYASNSTKFRWLQQKVKESVENDGKYKLHFC